MSPAQVLLPLMFSRTPPSTPEMPVPLRYSGALEIVMLPGLLSWRAAPELTVVLLVFWSARSLWICKMPALTSVGPLYVVVLAISAILGAGTAIVPATATRFAAEAFRVEMNAPWRAAVTGAGIGGAAGYGAGLLLFFFHPIELATAAFGAAFAARGAYLQAYVRRRRWEIGRLDERTGSVKP